MSLPYLTAADAVPPAAGAAFDDAFLELDESTAVRLDFDRVAAGALGRIALFIAVTAAIYAIVLLSAGRPGLGAVAALNAVGAFLLLRARGVAPWRARVRPLTSAVLLAQYALLITFGRGDAEAVSAWTILFPFLVLLLRLETAELLLLLGGLVAETAVLPPLLALALAPTGDAKGDGIAELLVPHTIVVGLVLAVSLFLTRRHRRRFLAGFRAERLRQHDRLRMKRELEQAREIQLSMLPRVAPEIDWLNVASLSLPATEVGGDYYDYFPLDDDRLAVVVADVAGHGVASGLVLSGVRSGLNMLEEELGTPSSGLGHLNRMVRRTAPRKMLVSMLICVLDRRSRGARLAAAGSPPPLLWSRHREGVLELSAGSLPLGVRDDIVYAEAGVDLEPGDVLLLSTDGAAETVNEAGELYGYRRLADSFEAAAPHGSAREVRDALLRDLWSFKGHASQIDDVTFVVIRVGGDAAGLSSPDATGGGGVADRRRGRVRG